MLMVMVMKWKNKGHEFDKIADDYRNFFGGKGIYVFGTGDTAKEYVEAFKKFNILQGFIDNDIAKQGNKYFGKTIYSLEVWTQRYKEDSFIVVCVNELNYKEIAQQLLECDLREGENFVWYKVFYEKIFPVLLFYEHNRTFLPLVQISLTERCTLKCKKCAHACNFVSSNAMDLSFDEVCYSADALFEYVDYVRDFVLIGGEPFLYRDLAEVINYIGTKYRDKIEILSITTNGTIVPNDKILSLFKKFNIFVRVSNYSNALPRLISKHEELKRELTASGIQYIFASADGEWMDYGFECVDRKESPEQLTEVFDKCNTPCHEIRGSKFYFCVMARSVSENMKLNVGSDDYLDLDKINADKDKLVFFEYIMGYSDKGYLDMCNYCRGADATNYPIPVAEQMR